MNIRRIAMRKLLIGLFGAFLMLTLSAAAFAQGDKSAAAKPAAEKTTKKATGNNTNFVGAVSAVSASSITVKHTNGDKTAAINDKTKIKKDSDSSVATLADIKENGKVHVWASKDSSGNWTATTIRIMDKAPKA